MTRAFIGIGSNIEPALNVQAAIRCLARQTRLVGVSTVYLTAALDRPEQPPYYNCVAEIATDTSPVELKHRLLRGIERQLERQRTEDRFAARTIDLDLIVYGDVAMDEKGVTLPDPDILERPFLAVPLCELAPDMVLAEWGMRVCDIAARLSSTGMQALPDYTRLLREEALR